MKFETADDLRNFAREQKSIHAVKKANLFLREVFYPAAKKQIEENPSLVFIKFYTHENPLRSFLDRNDCTYFELFQMLEIVLKPLNFNTKAVTEKEKWFSTDCILISWGEKNPRPCNDD